MNNLEIESLSDENDDYDDEDTLDGRYLIFSLADRSYGIEIKFITEIVGMQNITEIPDMPTFIKGVINLRGKVIALIDVRDRFRMQSIGYNDKTCVIILSVNQQLIGLIVDTVKEVIKIPPNNMEEAPKFGEHQGNQFIKSIAKVSDEVKVLLNIEKLLKDEDKLALDAAISNQS
ncbi:chemotaxis protein CheW [Leptospira meyeri]|uniref:chemotaxis protein CheW n=1 Tax=Leptospira meyeri TaxID=29508 RepID=UPI000C2AAE43|nr:chemotaxis protein CheW [Leptospira meyeri]PKA26817.1 chemotaxis protein CheW [Leptospira sp. mixed culture ATI2-C-A1]MCW7487456.1 chemotaxis protein CheW [Leptospira meyeri]PJZ80741.1 chemotaxis protein CheW [Leptospira meyeri]PJZ96245.1 chemotaxis protein CheW [Leptospira meyeri]PKA11850.1 chemotaxis protein CheW [Leptospira meyeri]